MEAKVDIFGRRYDKCPYTRSVYIFFATYGMCTVVLTIVAVINGRFSDDLKYLALTGSSIGIGSVIGYLLRCRKARNSNGEVAEIE